MLYDSLRNEWNICEKWAPDATPISADDNDLPDDDDYVMSLAAAPLSMASRNWETEHRWHDHCGDVDDDDEEHTLYLSTRSLMDNLYVCFGFLVPSTEPTVEPKLSWDITQRTLVSQNGEVSSDLQSRVLSFVSFIVVNDLPSLPLDSWDLTCPHAQWPTAKYFTLCTNVVDCTTWYMINPINIPRPLWQLGVSSARTALHCFREAYDQGITQEVVALFTRMGIPFRTFISDLPSPGTCHHDVPLAWRSPGHCCTAREYAEYEHMLQEFLRRPYARAAILQGGIVWHLAMNVFGVEEAVACALCGPSPDVGEHGIKLKLPGRRHLYDDKLTEEEIQLIVGTYKQVTGMLVDFTFSI